MVAIHKISFLTPLDEVVYQTLRSIDCSAERVTLTEHEKKEYMLTVDEAENLFFDFPDLINETMVISDKCNVTIEFNKRFIPEYDQNINANSYLKELSMKGLRKRISQNKITYIEPYINRLNKELQIIEQMKFDDYFLIVWDFIKFAKSQGIYVGPGRGSAPASLVCYCLGISDVDPIKYNLLFERFLNPERITMPDIDTDFPDDKREEVIAYVAKRYGKMRVARICTFGTFKAKLALRDSSRVLKLNDTALNEILKCLNKYSTKDLATTTLEEIVSKDEDLLKLMDDYEEINKVIKIAMAIEGLPRNISTHAAGIIITRNDLVYHTPLDSGIEDIYQTQYEASDLESLGLLKMDFLGLRNLTIIDETIKLIKNDIPYFTMPKSVDDNKTYQMLSNGDVSGVFQLESQGMRKVLMDLRVSNFLDITNALALYRPGPMDIIPQFINRKFGREKVEYLDRALEEILKDTYGMIVYQEQIMMIARKIAGYTLGRADILRRAVSKKKLDILEAERDSFVSSSINQGYSRDVAERIYDYIVKFASYGFNKAHSVAYATLSYQTAFLKCHYTIYYYATLLSSVIGSDTDILSYYQDAKRHKITLVGPSVNESSDKFIIKDNKIIFPISIIHGLGNVKTNELLEQRKISPFNGFEDFVKRTKDYISSAQLETIIYSGALDEFCLSKKSMIDNYQLIINRMSYDFVSNIVSTTYETDEFDFKHLQEKEKMAIGINLKYGFMIRYHRLYEEYHLACIKDVLNAPKFYEIKVLGCVEKFSPILTKNGEQMAFMTISDEDSSIDTVIFNDIYKTIPVINKGDIVIVSGKTQIKKNRQDELQIVVNEIRKV